MAEEEDNEEKDNGEEEDNGDDGEHNGNGEGGDNMKVSENAAEGDDNTLIIIPDHVVNIFNKKFAEDIDNLADVDNFLAEYKTKEDTLAKAIEESEKQTCSNLLHMMKSCESMLHEMEAINVQVNEIVNQHASHKEKCSKVESEMKTLKSKVENIENEQVYIMWVREIQSLSKEIESCMQKKNMTNAIVLYNKLHELWSTLQQTSCKNLKKFVDDKCEDLFNTLKETLSEELTTLLVTIKYPFPTGISSPHFNKKEDTEEQFEKTLCMLAKLKPLHCVPSEYSLVTELLTAPLKKRFYFHFYGERHTNNPEKPEWYFTQIINWIKDHSSFLDDYIAPILNANQSGSCDLKMRFFKVLVNLVEEKLHDTIDVIRTNDVLVAHLIDETVTFEKELQGSLHISDSSIGCLHILLREDFLDLWLRLEGKFTLEWINDKLEDQEAWVPKFSELTTKDKNLIYYAPKCVDEFVTFLTMMNTRHQSLHNINAERKFLCLLVTSIDDFVNRMKDLSSGPTMSPQSQNFCSLVNGACYMFHVLEEWSEDVYFVELFTSPDDLVDDLADENKDGCDEKNIFHNVLVSLERFISSCVESLVNDLKIGLKAKLYNYKCETWQALPPLKDYIRPSLSSGACDMMLYIKEHLHTLEEKLCPDIFEKVWKQLTSMIDHLIFTEIVYESHFNEGGASQLQFDLKENLFVLFGQYTTRPDAYFKLLKDSCTLLNLSTGTAYLLKELLQQTRSKADFEESILTSLKDVGISYLNSCQAGRLINSRIDYWPVLT